MKAGCHFLQISIQKCSSVASLSSTNRQEVNASPFATTCSSLNVYVHKKNTYGPYHWISKGTLFEFALGCAYLRSVARNCARCCTRFLWPKTTKSSWTHKLQSKLELEPDPAPKVHVFRHRSQSPLLCKEMSSSVSTRSPSTWNIYCNWFII